MNWEFLIINILTILLCELLGGIIGYSLVNVVQIWKKLKKNGSQR